MGISKPEVMADSQVFNDVEQVCRQFEADLRKDKDTKIDRLVEGWEEPERSRLLCELIEIDIRAKRAMNHSVSPDLYFQTFPDDHAAIQEAFASQRDEQTILPDVLLEQLKTESNLRHLRFLAEGGLGQVFIAQDEKLRRDAAVKLIREDLTDDVDSCDQFMIEAEVTGRLDHPGIPVVYAIGQTISGRLFYAMQYVRGTRLDKLIRKHHKVFLHGQDSQWFGLKRLKLTSLRRGAPSDSIAHESAESSPTDSSAVPPLDLRELLEVFISVCHTVGYAHRRGILHRDIKPSNIIHGKFGETVVIDWGLALPIARQGVFKDIAEQTIAPRSGKSSRMSSGCIGTPAYMSPEQAKGDVPLTPASDIFSLGTLLYCILTGSPPYQGQTVNEVRQLAINCEFTPPSELIEKIPAPLAAICAKAMRAQISDRYRTTHELVADIREYLSDRPVSALPDSHYRHLMRWMRHHTQAVLATMLAVMLIASTVGMVGLYKSLALLKEQRTSQAQSQWATSEKSLREQSLILAADLAARTLANKIDIVYRTLELCSKDDELQASLKLCNEAPDLDAAQKIQAWLNKTVSNEPESMRFRSWFVMTQDGTYLARTPEFSGGKRSSSIGKRFAFRDYFHGLGQDLPPTAPALAPLEIPHNSSAIFSTMDDEMTVNLSVPIVDSSKGIIGALVVCVECREFGDLNLDKATDQQLLLVEGRGYPMTDVEWSDELGRVVDLGHPQWSAGVLLHHQSELYRAEFNNLPRVSDEVMRTMKKVEMTSDGVESEGMDDARLFTEGVYSDPVQTTEKTKWLAAYCPVRIETRKDSRIAQTGWFVIVQQRFVEAENDSI